METKERILLLLRYLKENTDEAAKVSAAQIRQMFREKGEGVSAPTLRDDIASLKKTGFDIDVEEINGVGTFYRYIDREWSLPELQILVDAVSAGQFLSVKKSEEMTEKLKRLTGPGSRERLRPSIRTEARLKAPNEQILYIVQAIRKAMDKDRRIVFKHNAYDADVKLRPKHGGYEYEVSPYATIWQKDRYYLVGWSEKHGGVARFRIDRMELPKVLSRKRRPAPEDLRLEDHSDRIFAMFDGPEETVVLRCRPHLMNQIVDQFGTEPDILRKDEKSLDVRVTVHLSPTFYGWLFQYAGEMKIVSPGNVCEQYAERLQTALDEALG